MAKKVKSYDLAALPKDPSKFLMWIAKTFICFPDLKKRKAVLRTHNMEGLKPPYMLICNHASMVDFNFMYKLTHPYKVNNVATIETFSDYPNILVKNLGVLCKRKFTRDIHLIKNMKYCLHTYKNIFCLFPEARFSLEGCTAYLPPSLGKMLKLLKVPVVVMLMKGNYVTCPGWNKINKKSYAEADATLILTAEELEALSAEEVGERVRQAMQYDDFRWQRENKIKIDHPKRAEGLNGLLYQCPVCKKEHMMHSQGTELWCENCGKRWELSEYGELVCKDGSDPVFDHVPDWVNWERANVREEVLNGTYKLDLEGRLETIPYTKFYKQGPAHFVHDCNGFTLTGTAYGEPFTLNRAALEQECIHIEYNYRGQGPCIDIGAVGDSYWFYPENMRDVVTKISFATEAIYAMHFNKVHENKNNNK